MNCVCNANSYFVYNNGGGSISCAQCPINFIQSLDGFTCVFCNATCQSCLAQSNSYRSDLNDNGEYATDANSNQLAQCFVCDSKTSVLSGNKCVSCKPLIFAEQANITAASCEQPAANYFGGLIIIDGNSNGDPTYFNVAFGTDTTVVSLYYSTYLRAVYRTCRTSSIRNTTACQTLGNLCVLNLYNKLGSGDACTAFNAILQPATSGSTTVWGFDLPWLNYAETYSIYQANYLSYINSNTPIRLNFAPNKCQPTGLAFYAAAYALNGTLLSYGQFNVTNMQLCNLLSSNYAQASPFSGSYFAQSCSISANALLNFQSSPVFYDFYLQYGNSTTLFPVPVETINYIDPSSNSQVNSNSDTTNHKLQRRIFLVDDVSAIVQNGALPKYIRYAQSITIKFNLVNGKLDGTIYPPLISINYNYISTSDLTQTATVSFQIIYSMSLEAQIQAIWISVGVIGFVAFVWSIFRTWIWSRRSGKLAVDVVTLFKFLMYLINGMANVFYIVMVGVAIYWLIFYKGQGLAYSAIPLDQLNQQDSFKSLLIVAFTLKVVDLVYFILVQCSYDVFFIDWERPKLRAASREAHVMPTKTPKSKDESNLITDDHQNNVSCWRSLFVG